MVERFYSGTFRVAMIVLGSHKKYELFLSLSMVSGEVDQGLGNSLLREQGDAVPRGTRKSNVAPQTNRSFLAHAFLL